MIMVNVMLLFRYMMNQLKSTTDKFSISTNLKVCLDTVIIWLMLSVFLFSKVITLSSFHCNITKFFTIFTTQSTIRTVEIFLPYSQTKKLSVEYTVKLGYNELPLIAKKFNSLVDFQSFLHLFSRL
jgi:hypothetical protein